MARLLHEIEWGQPLLPTPAEMDYETELVRRFSPWLAAAILSLVIVVVTPWIVTSPG